MAPIQLLVLMAIASPIALNIYGPAMPDIVTSLQTTQFHVQLGVTLYLLTLAIGQFFAGPLADRFGRRPVLLTGFALHVAGGLLAVFAVEIYQLLAGRVLQALGGCTGALLTRSIILDSHGKDKATGLMAYMTMSIAISQAFVPAFGGYANLLWGWQSVIVVNIAVGGLVLLFAYLHLPEQETTDTVPFNFALLMSKYRLVLAAKGYLHFALSTTLIASCFFAFLNSAPFIVRNQLSGNSVQYGVWYLSIAIGFMLGSFAAGKLSSRFGTDKMSSLGNGICLAAGLCMLVLLLQFELSYEVLFLPMAFFTFGRGISQPSAQSSALNCARSSSATASGLLGFIQLTIAALIAQIAPMAIQSSIIALPVFLMLASVAAWISYVIGKNLSRSNGSAPNSIFPRPT